MMKFDEVHPCRCSESVDLVLYECHSLPFSNAWDLYYKSHSVFVYVHLHHIGETIKLSITTRFFKTT